MLAIRVSGLVGWVLLLLASALLGGGCGRTAPFDAPRRDGGPPEDAPADAHDPFLTIVPLSHALVDVVFVVDRSGSMELPMDEGDVLGPSRWDALTIALERTLDVIDPEVVVGAKLFPDRAPDGD